MVRGRVRGGDWWRRGWGGGEGCDLVGLWGCGGGISASFPLGEWECWAG